LIALKELYVNTGELEQEFADNFEMGMDIRHEADYALTYDEDSARIAIENTRRFLHRTQTILKSEAQKK